MNIRKKLFIVKDDKYKWFQVKLVPSILEERIIGVRTPELRKIAKEVFDSECRDDYLRALPHYYYEENLVHFFVIAMIRDFEECVSYVDDFLPYVDCWPVSDQASPQVFKKNHNKLIPYVKKWISSDHTYTARFGIRMLMNEFLGDDFIADYMDIVASKQGDDYYLKMMIAWYFATAIAKRYDESIIYIENRRLDPWVHKKTIQKALESYRVSDEHKEYLKKLR